MSRWVRKQIATGRKNFERRKILIEMINFLPATFLPLMYLKPMNQH